MRGKIYILSTWIIFFVPFSIYGSEQPYKVQKTLKHEVTVTLKLLQIYITDKKGNPITDLAKSDFILYDNGKLKTITEFEKHLLTLPGEKADEEKPEIDKPIQPVKTPDKPPLITRKFLLFFDFAFNDAQGILKAEKAALHFIDTQLHPDDEVCIISYNTFKGLTLHEYFTTEHDKVRGVVESFGLKDAGGRAQNIIRDNFTEKREEGWIEEKRKILKGFQIDNYRSQVLNFSQELKDLAKALRYIPGRKHIILFSSGIANFILYSSTSGELRKSANIRNHYEEMCNELAASNSQVYPVNTAGKIVSHFKDRDDMGDYSLRNLAQLSGGIYYDNISSYKEITEQIHNITSSYYVLGYYIEDKWDGKYQKIKIKIKRKGCKVYGQSGYFNPKPFTEFSELEKLFHLIDLALSKRPLLQEPLYFPMITLSFSNKGKSNLVTISQISADIMRDISGGNIEVVTLIFDKKNNVVEMQKSLDSASKLAQDNVYFYSYFSLSPGDYDCRVVIRNLETGQGALSSSSITISENFDSGLILDPLLLLVPEKKAQYFEESDKNKKESTLSLSNIYSFDSTQYAPIVDSINKEITRIYAGVRCLTKDNTVSEIQFSAHLLHISSGKKIPISPFILNQIQELDSQIFLLELPIGELQSGKYSLYLLAEEITTQSKSHVNTTFTIK